jgi:hypothetical protein
VLDVLSRIEAALAESNIFARDALVDCALLFYLLEMTTVAVVVVADSNLFAVDALFSLVLFDLDDSEVLFTFDVPTERAFDHSIVF